MDEFDDLMKSLGMDDEDEPAPTPPEAEPLDNPFDAAPSPEMDELERLLAMDAAADEEQSFDAITEGSLVSTRSIYDAGGIIDDTDGNAVIYIKEDPAAAKKRARKSLFDMMTVKQLIALSIILVVIFIAAGTSAVLTARAIAQTREEIAAMAHFTPISMPVDAPNNANFIHINERLRVGYRDFTLSHISVGFSGTYFYFDEHFNTDDYIILLYDQNRRLYVRQQFDISHSPAMGTIMRFEPIFPDARFLTLHIQNAATREYGSFNYRLVGSFAFGAPLFINQPVPLSQGGDLHSGLRISHAQFNNVESIIYYNFNGHFTALGLRQRKESNDTFVHLWDDTGGVAVLTEPQASIYDAGRDAMVGRATFAPLMSLHSQVRVSFHDLYYVYPYPPVDLPLRFLSGRDQDYPHTLYLDRFRLNLEGIDQQGHLLVLVMHGLDAAGTRLRTFVDTSLYIDIGRGRTLTIPAEQVNVADIGTDVVFNLRPYMDLLNQVHIDRYTLILHTVEFGVPEVNVTLDLERAVYQPSARRETAKANIEAAFMSRLAYMSGEIARAYIVGFAPEVLNDTALAAFFSPRSLTERPMYGARVVLGDFFDNYTFLAVVESEWTVGSGADLQFFRTTHQVTARSSEGIWSVIEDEVL